MESPQKGVTYEDFEPSSEWIRDSALHTLQVYIPGYSKEQVKVQVTSTRKLRINGERPIKDDKVSRFRKEIPIPSDVDINKIAANFSGGTLSVKLPKHTTATHPPVKPLPPPPQTAPPPQVVPVPPQPQKKQEETTQVIPPKTIVEKQTNTNGTVNGDKETLTEWPRPPPPQSNKPEVTAQGSIEKKPEKAAASEKTKEAAETNSKKNAPSSCDEGIYYKSKKDEYKKMISGLAVELKRPRKLMNMVLVVSFVVVVAALFVKNQFGTSSTNSEN